jgi:hypothetical protein
LGLWSCVQSWPAFITSCYWVSSCNTIKEFKKEGYKVHAMETKKYEALSLNLNAWPKNELKVTRYAIEITFL